MTNGRLLRWERITSRPSAVPLQGFTCTTDCPRSLRGRKLPHPKPWELEVQSYLRQSSRQLKSGALLLIGRSADDAIAAAAHLMFQQYSTVTETFIAAVGVTTSLRGQGGAIADEALAIIFEVARERAASDGSESALVAGNIHVQNQPCEALVIRSGFEPYSVPHGDYQRWTIRLRA